MDPLGLSRKCSDGDGQKPDFYVGPAGPSATMRSTGYRYMRYLDDDGTVNKWAPKAIDSRSAPASYIGFEKYSSSAEAKSAFQIAPEWSDARLRGSFDTLQLYENGVPQVRVPYWEGDRIASKLEPFAEAYPQYGRGGAQQLHADNRIINFDQIDIID